MLKNLFKILNKTRILFWLVLVIFGVATLGWQVQSKLKQAEANIASLQNEEEIHYPVTLKEVELEDRESWRSYYGKAKAARTQDVTSWVREVVHDVNVQVGDKVKAGQTVVSLLKADHQAQARASQTAYEEARLNYNRLLELSKKGGVSQSEVDKAYATLKNEEAAAQSSQSTLQRTTLKASIDGVVSSRNVEPGEVAEVGKSLITIVDLSEMEVELMVSKKDINNINRNTPVELMLDSSSNGNADRPSSKGWVKRMSPEAQAGSGLYPVVVGLSPDSGILPGSYIEGRFMVDKKTNVVVVPADVVMYRGADQFVYVANGDKAELRKITTGEGRNSRVIVTSGLRPGDMLIVSGNRTLFDGALISKAK